MKRILFRCDRRIPEQQAAELFSALGWFSGEYPKELAASLRQATAWSPLGTARGWWGCAAPLRTG